MPTKLQAVCHPEDRAGWAHELNLARQKRQADEDVARFQQALDNTDADNVLACAMIGADLLRAQDRRVQLWSDNGDI